MVPSVFRRNLPPAVHMASLHRPVALDIHPASIVLHYNICSHAGNVQGPRTSEEARKDQLHAAHEDLRSGATLRRLRSCAH